MRTIEQLLSSGKGLFFVDEMACMEHAQILTKYKRPIEKFSWSSYSKPEQLLFKVAFISICHQFNWDFLQSAMAKLLLEDPQNMISVLRTIDARQVKQLLADYPKQERVRASERAAILRDVGTILEGDFDSDLEIFYRGVADSRIDSGEFHSFMDRFQGYRSDPLRKKTNVLSHDLLKEGIVDFGPDNDVLPAIDYHIMRVYLRTGRVVPVDEAVFRDIQGKPNPRGALVKSLRETVSNAEELTAHYANLSVADVNYIEWQVGRSICLNDSPQCGELLDVSPLPSDLVDLCENKCPYSETCLAFNRDLRFISFEEPNYVSTHY